MGYFVGKKLPIRGKLPKPELRTVGKERREEEGRGLVK